ncbi:head fiber protein, partial [Salmonella sp. S127_66822]|uniref:head fiber protein n=1 Tax=Salmonella sp. S127_66822 TaxID=2665616 RepID=UPI001CA866F8
MTRITRSYIAPNPKEFEYWVDLSADPKGNVIKYYAGGSKWLPLNDDTDNDQSARIAALELGKVDKVEGKELSSNDFTDAYKTKLDGIAAQANKYVLPTATAEIIGGVKVGAN